MVQWFKSLIEQFEDHHYVWKKTTWKKVKLEWKHWKYEGTKYKMTKNIINTVILQEYVSN